MFAGQVAQVVQQFGIDLDHVPGPLGGDSRGFGRGGLSLGLPGGAVARQGLGRTFEDIGAFLEENFQQFLVAFAFLRVVLRLDRARWRSVVTEIAQFTQQLHRRQR
ncbi:hypothetical protein WR25_14376 [Diploscapter pachys]|uniref:Uncharacterized protein n=1 Tax=Diploscapter pachys TaxID=2018661 RepID=A0A2A2KF15_9BILA|nr:hypothetical protein WR25_14376 [Diploscapter pachys]